MPHLSVSQMGEWLACKHRWKLGYRHNLKPIVTHSAIVLGSIVHQGLEAGWKHLFHSPGDIYGADSRMTTAIDEAIDQQNLSMDDDEREVVMTRAMTISQRGIRTFDTGPNGQWEVVEYEGNPAVELHLEVPLPGWDGFQCYMDLVLRHRSTGTNFIVDHKVRKTFVPEASEETNLQNAVYQYMAAFNGIENAGTMTHQISSVEESLPKLTTKGEMSRAMIKCSWETYRRCLVEEGLDPDDYVEMASKLKGEFVRVYQAYRSSLEIQNTWRYVVLPTAQEVLEAKMLMGDPAMPRIFNHRECNGCLFRAPCIAELRGDDVDFIVRTNYELKKGRWKPREDPTRQGVQ